MPDRGEDELTIEADSARGTSPSADRRAKALRRRRSASASASASARSDSDEPEAFDFDGSSGSGFARLGTRMTMVAAVTLATTVGSGLWFLVLMLSFPDVVPIMLFVLVPMAAALAVGVWTLRAGRRFSAIASTSGADVQNLMVAVDALTKVYTLHLITIVVSVLAAAFAWLGR